MIISIFASIWAQNLWDELILKNEIEIFRARYHDKNPKFIVFTYDIENIFYIAEDVVYFEYFPIDSKKIANIPRNIANFFRFLWTTIKSDLIVIWWGWIIYDNEKQTTKSPLDQWIFRTSIFRLFFKKFSFFWIGISVQEESLEKIKKIFKKAYKIEVRDQSSFEILEKMSFKPEIILDPVFYDNGEVKINKKLCLAKLDSRDFSMKDFSKIDFAWTVVWLALRRWYISKTDNPALEILIIKEVIEFIQLNWARKIILLPHSFHKTDILANDFEWMNLILEKTKNVSITNSLEETYEVYKWQEMDLIIAERLHSIILSNVYKIPFIALSYSKKTFEVLREF